MQKKILISILRWSTLILICGVFIFYWVFIRYEAADFKVSGRQAFMNGVIDATTPERVKTLIDNHGNLKTIVMVEVPGSADDEANLKAARMVRKAGLNTHIPADGVIASGGVDFYLAGNMRTMDRGAKFGVHSWGGADDDGNELVAAEVPVDHKMHKLYLSYYREIGISDDFYWYTLKAAPAESIHWMTPAEIKKYRILKE